MATTFTLSSNKGLTMKRTTLLVSLALVLSSSYADAPKEWDAEFATTKMRYLIYSGTLGETEPPQAGNKKLSMMFEGRLARELFDSIGPDQKDACGASTGVRMRERGDISCSYDRDQKSAPFTCYVGLNLKTGKSMAGSIC
jgi:hypothetical protein